MLAESSAVVVNVRALGAVAPWNTLVGALPGPALITAAASAPISFLYDRPVPPGPVRHIGALQLHEQVEQG